MRGLPLATVDLDGVSAGAGVEEADFASCLLLNLPTCVSLALHRLVCLRCMLYCHFWWHPLSSNPKLLSQSQCGAPACAVAMREGPNSGSLFNRGIDTVVCDICRHAMAGASRWNSWCAQAPAGNERVDLPSGRTAPCRRSGGVTLKLGQEQPVTSICVSKQEAANTLSSPRPSPGDGTLCLVGRRGRGATVSPLRPQRQRNRRAGLHARASRGCHGKPVVRIGAKRKGVG